MVLGFNHNVRYKGDVFHIQTEDSGVANPHIITLLYRGGTILSSKKTSYADILKIENLEQVVEELMKEQHKEMLRRLKQGEFDAKAFPDGVPGDAAPAEAASAAAEVAAPAPAAAPAAVAPPAPVAAKAPPAEPVAPPAPPVPEKRPEIPASVLSLDEIILDYFAYEEK